MNSDKQNQYSPYGTVDLEEQHQKAINEYESAFIEWFKVSNTVNILSTVIRLTLSLCILFLLIYWLRALDVGVFNIFISSIGIAGALGLGSLVAENAVDKIIKILLGQQNMSKPDPMLYFAK